MGKYFAVLIIPLFLLGILSPTLLSIPVQAAAPVEFTNVTDRAGLAYSDSTWGWAWGDYDGDRQIDLFLGHHPILSELDGSRPSALMRNNGDGAFANRIQDSGILLSEDRHDMAFVDYDDDGDLDLWVSVGGRGGMGDGPKQLYRQGPAGQFVDVATEAGVVYPPGRGRGTAWLDYDLDGDLDMLFTGAEREDAPNSFFRNNGDGTFTDITAGLGLDPFVGAQSQVAVADYDLDGDPDIFVTGTLSRLYRNDGDHFTPVHEEAGIHSNGAQGADWGDFDNDGDPDLYVTRGSSDESGDFEKLSASQDEIRFVAVGEEGDEDGLDFTTPAGAQLTLELQSQNGGNKSQSPNMIYLGADGHNPTSNPFTIPDGSLVGSAPVYTPGVSSGYFIWQDAPGSWHVRWTGLATVLGRFSGILSTNASFDAVTEIQFEPFSESSIANQLFRNNGDGTFEEIGAAAGVADPVDCRGVDWGDYDNDGDLDLFVGTTSINYTVNLPNHLYRNNGDGTFTDAAASSGVTGASIGSSWGGLFADYNNDGFLDLLTNHGSWPWPLERGGYELFRNGGNANHWSEIEVNGDSAATTTQGYGAKLWITTGSLVQYRDLNDSSHYFNHYTGPVHFGLGSAVTIDQLVVEWADGFRATYQNIPADKLIQLSRASGISWEQDPEPTQEPTQEPTKAPTSDWKWLFIPVIRR